MRANSCHARVVGEHDGSKEYRTAVFWQAHTHALQSLTCVRLLSHLTRPFAARAPARFRSDWRNQYWCLPRIMARFPHADGFLWTNDDVMLNYWNLLKADKTKLWLPNDPNDIEVRHFPFNEKAELDGVVSNHDVPSCKQVFCAFGTAGSRCSGV